MGKIMVQAVNSRPRPQLIVVATDLETPWPTQPEMLGVPVVICGCNSVQHYVEDLPKWADYIEISDTEWEQQS